MFNKFKSKVKSIASNIGSRVGSLAASVGNAIFPQPTGVTRSGIAPTQNSVTGFIGPVQPTPFTPVLGGGNIRQAEQGFGATTPAGFFPQPQTRTSGQTSGGQTGTFSLSSSISPDGMALTNNIGSFSSPAGSTVGRTSPSVPSASVVNTPNLGASNMFNYPEKTDPDFGAAVPLTIDQAKVDAEAERKAEQDAFVKDLLKLDEERESPAEIDARLQRELGIKQKEQAVNALTEQLNSIVNKGQAAQLSLIGQGRGIPEAIIGGQQAQIGRETAIAALPVQAQLEAAQGNLEMANASLDRLFKLYSEEAERDFTFKKEVRTFLYDSATAEQKLKLEEMEKAEERAYDELQALNDERSAYAKMAFSTGQSSLGAKIAGLDYKDKNFLQDLNGLIAQIRVSGGSGTSDMKEYEFAKSQGYEGSFMDYKNESGGFQGFSGDDTVAIKNDIETYGINKVLEGVTDPKEVAAIKALEKETSKLTRSGISLLYGIPDDDVVRKKWFGGFNVKSGREQLDEIMNAINQYKGAGFDDDQILKKMEEGK